MKSAVLLLVIAVVSSSFFSVESASKCYSCVDCSSSKPTGDPTDNCPASNYFCVKTIVKVSGTQVISKGCAPTCEEASGSLLGISTKVKCCTSDLCNAVPARSYNLWALMAGLMWAIIAVIYKN